jgi:hypothetical protein
MSNPSKSTLKVFCTSELEWIAINDKINALFTDKIQNIKDPKPERSVTADKDGNLFIYHKEGQLEIKIRDKEESAHLFKTLNSVKDHLKVQFKEWMTKATKLKDHWAAKNSFHESFLRGMR